MSIARHDADSAREILAGSEAVVRRRRQADVNDLELLLAWADLHSTAPAVDARGGDRLVALGGDGTPEVRDLCLEEIAVARQASVVATRHVMADALDLRHRLRLLWAAVCELRCEAWVARKVARMSRRLDRDQVRVVDAAVAAAVAQSPGRVIDLAEAKIIEADRATRVEDLRSGAESAGAWVAKRPRPGEVHDGLRSVFARLPAADAIWLDGQIDRVADLLAGCSVQEQPVPWLASLPGGPTRDQLRAAALGLLGRPDQLARIEGCADAEMASRPGGSHRRAVLYVHLHQGALDGSAPEGVARVEGVGPMLVDQVRDLLGFAEVRLAPVVDLAGGSATHAYEHPESVKERTFLRTGGDVFPHAPGTSRNIDHDHATPYCLETSAVVASQTGDHNDAPLARHSHRAKTHLAYRVRHLGPGVYLWTTPHGLQRLVTPAGTHRLDPTLRLGLSVELARAA